MCEKNEIQNRKQQIRLIGIGMGSAASMTREGAEAIEDSDCLIGARRMLEAAGGKAAVFCEYRAGEILSYIEAHPEYGKIGVVLSGVLDVIGVAIIPFLIEETNGLFHIFII